MTKEQIVIRSLELKIKSDKWKMERLKSKDDQYWCLHPDENGNKIPMTKVKGSRVMSKEEVEELNKIKLPF